MSGHAAFLHSDGRQGKVYIPLNTGLLARANIRKTLKRHELQRIGHQEIRLQDRNILFPELPGLDAGW
jgi:hypothetical protein